MGIVSIRKCDDYEYDNVKKSLDKNLEDIGGIEKYIKPNSKVLVKPNLLIRKDPKDVTTTHPMLVKVICEKLLELNCKVVIADSPGGPYTSNLLKGLYKSTGMKDVADELGVELNYDVSEVKVENKEARTLRFMDIISPVNEADYIIDICKLKTHVMATYTGGVKNLYGCIAGMKKAEIHYRFPDEKSFCEEVLLDICSYVKSTLTIMDAIIGMEGEGPSSGKPRKIGLTLASASPYELDAIACKLINLDVKSVPTLRGSVDRGYINEDLSGIDIVGEDVEKFIIKDYKIPKSSKDFRLLSVVLPKFLNEPIAKFLTPKPAVVRNKCIKCKKCMKICPAKAISFENEKIDIDLNKCIRCYCCHELCPQKAINVRRNIIFKLIR